MGQDRKATGYSSSISQEKNLRKQHRPKSVRGQVSANKGRIDHVVAQPNSESGGWRLSFQLAPENESLVELRAQLLRNDEALSEVWLYCSMAP